MYVYLCENSIEGIFTGVYDAWASGYGHRNIRLSLDTPDTYELFCEYITVIPDENKSCMVGRTLRRHFGQEVYQDICQAILSQDTRRNSHKQLDKADCVYRTILYGFAMPDCDCHRVLQALGVPYIAHIFELSRATYMSLIICWDSYDSVNWKTGYSSHPYTRRMMCLPYWQSTLPTGSRRSTS